VAVSKVRTPRSHKTDAVVAAGHDVLGGQEQLLDGGAHAALAAAPATRAADLASKSEKFCMLRAPI
jgi:hypothetical protein